MGNKLTDKELIDEWMIFFGPGEGIRMLGWCSWMYIQGARSFDDVRQICLGRVGNSALAQRASYYSLKKLRLFRERYALLEGRVLSDNDEVIIEIMQAMRPEVAA